MANSMVFVDKHHLCLYLGFVIAFTYSWKLTLVIMAASPVLAVAGFIMGKILANFTSQESGAYAKAGKVVRTVSARVSAHCPL